MRVNSINYAMPRLNRSVGVMSNAVAFGKEQTPLPDLKGIWHNEADVIAVMMRESTNLKIYELPNSIRRRRYPDMWEFDTPEIPNKIVAKLEECTKGKAECFFSDSDSGSMGRTIKVNSMEALRLVTETLQDLFGAATLQRHLDTLAANARKFLG